MSVRHLATIRQWSLKICLAVGSLSGLSLWGLATLASSPAIAQKCSAIAGEPQPAKQQSHCDRPQQQTPTAMEVIPFSRSNAVASTPRLDLGPQPTAESTAPIEPSTPIESSTPVRSSVDVDPDIIESSPVLQRWLEEVPNVAVDIQHDPAFRTRMRVGYAEFPSTDNTGGVYVGIQDVFIGRTPLTLSAEYAANGRGDRQLIGADAQYYLLPLGWYGNIAPVVGYRAIDTPRGDTSGINLGVRVIIIPSRTGTADLSVTQSWVAPGSEQEVGLTTFAAGYAIAEDFRVGTDIQIQNARDRQESRVSLLLEWML